MQKRAFSYFFHFSGELEDERKARDERGAQVMNDRIMPVCTPLFVPFHPQSHLQLPTNYWA